MTLSLLYLEDNIYLVKASFINEEILEYQTCYYILDHHLNLLIKENSKERKNFEANLIDKFNKFN